jgi:hypothetical protein
MDFAMASTLPKFSAMIRSVIDDLVEVVLIREGDKSSPPACFTPENAALLAGKATAEKTFAGIEGG